jgi:hypothetical protein
METDYCKTSWILKIEHKAQLFLLEFLHNIISKFQPKTDIDVDKALKEIEEGASESSVSETEEATKKVVDLQERRILLDEDLSDGFFLSELDLVEKRLMDADISEEEVERISETYLTLLKHIPAERGWCVVEKMMKVSALLEKVEKRTLKFYLENPDMKF